MKSSPIFLTKHLGFTAIFLFLFAWICGNSQASTPFTPDPIPAKYNEPGVIEGESLKGVSRKDGDFAHLPYAVSTQEDAPDVFSGNRILFWGTDHGATSKEQMELNIPIKTDGRYQVFVRLAKGPTYGILKITFEDNDVATIDCYAPKLTPTDAIDIGTYDMTAGDHPLDFMMGGTNPASAPKNIGFGVDYIKVVPVAPIEPAHFKATGADDCSIHSITVGEIHPVDANSGDTWDLAWTRQNTLYSPSNDTAGFHLGGNHNLMFNKILGNDPTKLDGATVNDMAECGITGASMGDNCTWKSSGCISLDGVLYWLVARHRYGGDRSIDYDKRQKAHDASFIKSVDRGKTWTRSPQENKDHPMFPGSRFATPYFVQYGQDGHEAWADGSDKYVYALSNNGFWDNGDWVILGRVLRSKMGDLNGADWQFYTQGDGLTDGAWTSNVREAKAVLANPDHLGMTRAVYLPKHQCYLMIGWYYPDGGGKLEMSDGLPVAAHVKTNWDFYVAPHPWGPWRNVGSHTFTPQGYYTPGICPKFNSADESTVWAFTAGDWTSPYYRLTAVSLSIH
jgi:hypothetical protein